MSHKYVSNKQTLHNTSFLSKLAGTLSGRVGTLDESTDTLTSSIEWRSTKSVSKRIKTATGTIAIYEDTPAEEVARLQAEALEFAGGAAPPTAKPLDARAGKVPQPPPPPPPPAPPAAAQQQQQQYVVVTEYTTTEGAKVVVGQKMLLITTSSSSSSGSSKRPLSDDMDSELQLLDNSAAKHKMAIRPKKTRPDSRTLAASASASKIQATNTEQQQQQQPQVEEWLMQSVDGKDSIWLPKHVLQIDTSAPPPPPPAPPSQKRPAEDEEDGAPGAPSGDALRSMMLQEIREFKTKKKKSSSRLGPSPEDEARSKRSATVRELIETEEELVRDLHFAVENYFQLMDQTNTPRHIRDQKELIFSNFNFFPDFHKNVLIEGIKYHAEVPRMIGKTFLRLERDFDQHAEYCSSEPLAQEFLENNSPVREYFEEHSQKIGDDKRIQEHLQLPIQRLNDYQLLLRELVKYGNVLGDDTEELSKALELMQTIPQRATDAKFIASIEGFRGNLYKLGRLIRHDWFSVRESGHHKAHDRYLFLFKARILVTKVKRIAGDRSIFLLKNVIRLPETSLGSLDDPKKLEFLHIEAENHLNYPIVIEARTPEARDAWLEGVQEHVVETASVDDLLFDDEIRIVSEEGEEIDEGRVIASPVPEDFEDFPDDTNLEELPEDQGVPAPGRVIPIVLEDNDNQVVPDLTKELKKGRGKGDEESSPLPARKKAKADLLELDEQVQLNQFATEQVQSKTVESVIQSSTSGFEGETTNTTFTSSSLQQSSTVVDGGVESSTTSTTAATTTIVGDQQKADQRQVETRVQAEPDVAETELYNTQISVDSKFESDNRLRQQQEEIQQEKEVVVETPSKKKRSIGAEPAATDDQKKAKMSEPQTPATPGGGPRPVFTKTLIGAVVEPGEAAVFICNVTHPVPYFVTWLKDNKLMDDKLADRVQQTDDGVKHELKILNCRPEDTGIYTAKATDTEQSSATCSAQLLVQELTEEERNAKIADKKPFFLVKLRDTTVIETTNLSYVVQAKGDPTPEVKFFKDGQPLKEDDRVQFQKDLKQGKYELLIRHVQKTDAGVYKCTAMNQFGDVDCQGKMSVLEEQEALESLQGKGSLLAAGEQADFKWFRDGQEFDPLERFNVHYKDEEDTLALVFQNVTPEDAGLYTCVASTSCGKISCSAELTVEGAVKRLNKEPKAPEVADPLSDSAVSAGSSAFLECKITGFPVPDLAWTRNGLEVKVGGRIKQMWEDDDCLSLIIKNIKESDAGLYRLVAKNELGECDTDCKLAIRAGPKIKRMKKEVACNVDNALNYNVEVEGEPLPEVKWLKDGKELLDSDRIKLVKESDTVFAFKISSMTLADCGTYTVIASNDIGQRSEQFQVMCDSPPQITRGLDPETEKKLSNDHTFEVRASGSPSPTARWYKDNKEIMGDDKFRMVKDDAFYMLKIRRLDRKDKGVYKIVLTNATGEAESEGALVIRAPPEFLTPLKDACAKEGTKDVKMFVEFQGNPKPTIKWTFKDKPIRAETEGFTMKNTDTTSMLVISEALADFVGNYTVTLGNEYGDSVGKAKFRLHEAPVIVEGLKDVEFLEDNTAKIVIKATGVPVPEIKWTLDGKKYSPDERRVKLKKEGDEVFMIWTDDAKTEDTGLYQATITNCEGTVTTEANVIVNTPPHILNCNFKDGKKVVAMHKFLLEVEATAVPEATATWFVNNQEIKEAEDVKFNFDGKKYTLERIGCDPEHSGEYSCKLKNKIKEEAVSGQVTVYEKESRVRNALKDIYVKEFTSATLKCQIVGDPVPSVEWLRDGKPIPPSGRFEISEDRSTHWHTLIFKDVAEKDKSVFTVKGKNTHGECETSCNLGVLVKPQPGELNSDTVDYGKNVKLSVSIHAYPPPKMVWTLNGKELTDCEHTEYQRDEETEIYSLYLTSAVLEDIGTYAFTASNEAGEASGDCKLHVHSVVPTVGLELKSQAICLEDEVTFTLRCCGLPLPVPQWTKKGVVQKGDERTIISTIEADTHTITFKDVSMEDYGKIEVVATSVVGKTSSSCDLSQMTMQCEVLEGLENLTKGAEGEDVTLSVLIRASPRPVVIWTKDGDQLVDGDKIKMFTEKVTYCDMKLSLTLVEATSLESGQYRVKFSNLVNEASSETALVVRPERKAPKIRGKPADAEVTEKGPAMFKCKIAGFPRPDVKWMKDGRQVRPTDVINMGMTADGQFFLEFRHCTSEDAGTYTVVAENEEGKTEATMNLTVNPPASRPEFLQGLRATKVIRGYPCRMEVKCGGFPKPTIAWLKDGQPLEVDGKHIKQIELEDGTVILQIDEATDADAGRYSCVARNADGDNTSSAPLGVLGLIREDGQPDGPAAFTSGLKDTCADEGKTLILPVAVKGGPVPNMKWYKDGKEIKLDDRMFFTYDGDRSFLEIRPCRGSDSGVYRCEVEGADGSKASTECTVTVRKCFEAPSFAQGFNSLQQLPGMDIRLSVRADGVPRPELSWFKDNKPIDMSDDRYKLRKDGQSTTLLIRECTYSDSAIYKCVATNKEGSAEHEAAVEVADEIDPNRRAEAPVFLKVIGDQEVFENDHAKFKAIVSGKPIPDFQWLKNGHPIIETNRVVPERDIDGIVRLTLRHVTEEDSGSYTLKVWNDYGKASCMGKLTCECISKKVRRPVGDEYQGWDKMKRSGIPIPLPDKPYISALSDRRATISWNPYIAQGPQPPVTYQVEMCESPEGEWFTARTGIRGTSVDITNLAPKCDYKFRIRNENKFGVSEPSPYVATYRNKLEVPPVNYEPKLNTNYEPTGDGPYVPEGFSIDRDNAGNYFAPPRFLRLVHDTQYGQRSFNSCIKWYAFGYPTPKIRFTFNGKPLETGIKGSRITHTQEANGEIMLFVDKITDKDVGDYECHAKNEHGESKQKIKFELAEYPRVTQHLEETHIRSHATGRIMCRIAGYPPCNVQWYKDWAPLKTSFRLRPQFIEPDMYILNFNGAIVRDCGLYSLSAVNVAGVASSSCMVQVEDDDDTFVWTGPGKGRHVQINRRRGQLEDHYDVGDELGRGTQGITYHCVEHFTGRNFAAKSMWGRDRFKVWMHLEHEMMNLSNSCRYITRLYDCYESAKNMVLVMELCAGGELLQTLTQHQYITEYEVAHYVRQLLEGLEYLHDRCIAHLGLNIGDVMLTRPNGTDVKLGDLSLARTIRIAKLQPLDYGMPEYVAPEVALGKGVSYAADMWAVGVITYLLLSGTSPFRGDDDRETLTKVQKGELTFDVEAFSNISPEAKDFMAKLLQFKPENRLEVKAALIHPWLVKSQLQPRDPYKINTDNLRTYAAKFREWYANASCRRWYRRRPLQSAFTHPSKMVYPPGEVYTPPDSPDREMEPIMPPGDYVIPQKDLSYELDPITSESNYQQGPDTYLLQLRDVDFPVRLRQYMKIAANRSPAYAAQVRENLYDYTSATPQSDEKKSKTNEPAPIETVYSLREKYDSSTYDYCCSPGEINLDRYIRIPVVHERRRFTDIMDEEIDDERRRTIVDKYSSGFVRQNATTCSLDLPRRVTNEVRSRTQSALVPVTSTDEATLAPFLREKPATCCVGASKPVTLSVLATGKPAPIVQWFRNDIILAEGGRLQFSSERADDSTTRASMTMLESRENDVGSYKVVARNQHGQTLHRFRLVQACLPSICDCPEVGGASDTSVLLQWKPPMEDGGSHVLAYHLQIKAQGDLEWRTVDDGADMERYVVPGLTPNSLYQFRIAARNSLGWGEFSIGTPAIRTGPAGCPKLKVPPGLAVEDHKSGVVAKQQKEVAIDYSKEDEPVTIKTGEGADLQVRKYKVVDELSRGRFSTVGRCVRSDDHRLFAVKVLATANRDEQVRLELDLLRSLRHQRLALLHEAYQLEETTVMVQELLSGVDIVTYLSQRHSYSEQTVAVLMTQVLDGLSYLQWRGVSHLDLQPDNLVLSSTRFPSVKLVDFGSARKVEQTGTAVPVNGLTDYIAPEVLFDGKAYPNTDIWSLGVLTYVLLSGVTPFRGDTEEDLKANIQCVRYRFEWLPTTTTQEANRFLMLIFKRDPSKRPTVSECLEHRWLNETDFMVRKRERASIISNRIRDYSQQYHGQRSKSLTNNKLLLNFAGLKQ